MTDKEIYEGIARKDNKTFQFLYNEHIGMIINLVQKNSGSKDEARDLFQEGMIALWTNIQKERFQLNKDIKISSYLYALCRNIWISKLRKAKYTKPIDELTNIEGPVSGLDEMEENYNKINQLTAYLEKLNDSCQQLLKLFYYKKNSLKQIASKMNFTEKTAKNNKYRCMKNLRALYLG